MTEALRWRCRRLMPLMCGALVQATNGVRHGVSRTAPAIPAGASTGQAPGCGAATEAEAQSTRKVCDPSLNTMSANSARAVPC